MNPYNCTMPNNCFVGYDSQLNKISNGLKNGNSYAVLGGRRCGKTSFLIQIEKLIKEHGLEPFFPIICRFSILQMEEISAPFLFETMYNISFKELNVNAWQNSEKGKEYRNFLLHIDRNVSLLNQKYGSNWIIIILIDELDAALKKLPDDNFFLNIRHLLMESRFNRNFRLIATGVREMARLITSGASPLNNLRNIYLNFLPKQDAKSLVDIGFPDIDKQIIDILYDRTGGHPCILQGILEVIWDLNRPFTEETINCAAKEFLFEHKLFPRWKNEFSLCEQKIYESVANSWPNKMQFDEIRQDVKKDCKEHVFEALNVLSYHCILDAISLEHIEIAGTFFKDWFLQNSSESKCNKNNLSHKIFISCVREDRSMAKKIYNDLKQNDMLPWMQSEDLLPGQDIRQTIMCEMKKSSYIIILISNRSISHRGFFQKEIKMALELLDELPQEDIFLIPVCIDECDISDEKLNKIYPVRLFESYEMGLRKIIKSITKANKKNIIQG